MSTLRFVAYCMAVWRISYLLTQEDGPFGVALKLRERTGITYSTNGIALSWPDWNPLYCTYCTSVWVAMLVYLLPAWIHTVSAASGFVVFIERYLDGKS